MFHTEFAKKTVRAHYLTSTRLLPNRQSAILFPPRQLYESRPLTELHLRKAKLNLRIKVEAVTAGPDAKLSDICAQIWTTNLKNTVASAPTLTGSVLCRDCNYFSDSIYRQTRQSPVSQPSTQRLPASATAFHS